GSAVAEGSGAADSLTSGASGAGDAVAGAERMRSRTSVAPTARDSLCIEGPRGSRRVGVVQECQRSSGHAAEIRESLSHAEDPDLPAGSSRGSDLGAVE